MYFLDVILNEKICAIVNLSVRNPAYTSLMCSSVRVSMRFRIISSTTNKSDRHMAYNCRIRCITFPKIENDQRFGLNVSPFTITSNCVAYLMHHFNY